MVICGQAAASSVSLGCFTAVFPGTPYNTALLLLIHVLNYMLHVYINPPECIDQATEVQIYLDYSLSIFLSGEGSEGNPDGSKVMQ